METDQTRLLYYGKIEKIRLLCGQPGKHVGFTENRTDTPTLREKQREGMAASRIRLDGENGTD